MSSPACPDLLSSSRSRKRKWCVARLVERWSSKAADVMGGGGPGGRLLVCTRIRSTEYIHTLSQRSPHSVSFYSAVSAGHPGTFRKYCPINGSCFRCPVLGIQRQATSSPPKAQPPCRLAWYSKTVPVRVRRRSKLAESLLSITAHPRLCFSFRSVVVIRTAF